MKELVQMILTFALTVFAWIFFRADNIGHAVSILIEMFSTTLFTYPSIRGSLALKILLVIFVTVEWFGREKQYAIQHLGISWKRPLRYAVYCAIVIAIFLYGGKEQEFIYFQF